MKHILLEQFGGTMHEPALFHCFISHKGPSLLHHSTGEQILFIQDVDAELLFLFGWFFFFIPNILLSFSFQVVLLFSVLLLQQHLLVCTLGQTVGVHFLLQQMVLSPEVLFPSQFPFRRCVFHRQDWQFCFEHLCSCHIMRIVQHMGGTVLLDLCKFMQV